MKLFHCFLIAGALTAGVRAANTSNLIGMEELHRLDRLPAFKRSVEIGCVSSYDRSGGNDDGFSGKYSHVRKEAEGLILADLKGPGIIYRLWTPTPSDDVLEFIFDGEPQPRIAVKFRELFLGKHPAFPAPLAGFGAGGYWSYTPLPFAKSCVVRLRADKAQFYQINYALYPIGTQIITYDPDLANAKGNHSQKAAALWSRAGTDISRAVAPPEADIQMHTWSAVVQPGSSETVFHADKGGRIVGLRFSPASAIAGRERDLLLRIAFDGDEPAISCPLGDFFGYAWGQPAMRSLLAGAVGETTYCYLPMPFERAASIEVVSQRASPVALRAEVLHASIPQARDEGKLYALWRRDNPTKIGESYTLLETEGRGHLVGVVLQAQGFESGKTLFFEGDDETYIDGKSAIHGTGSEDFFNGGWYDVPDRWEKRICFPLAGCLGYAKHLGRTAAYRFFIGDAYPYQKKIRQIIEHAGENNSIPTDYSSLTYFYSERRPTADLNPPPVERRTVEDLREVLFPAWWQLPINAWSFERATLSRKKEKVGSDEVRFLSLAADGQDWFGPHFISPVCDVPSTGTYAIYIEAVKGPAQSKVQLFQNENPVAEAVDFYSENRETSGRVLLGCIALSEGKNNLMVKLIGRNDKASSFALDLISVICVREPR